MCDYSQGATCPFVNSNLSHVSEVLIIATWLRLLSPSQDFNVKPLELQAYIKCLLFKCPIRGSCLVRLGQTKALGPWRIVMVKRISDAANMSLAFPLDRFKAPSVAQIFLRFMFSFVKALMIWV